MSSKFARGRCSSGGASAAIARPLFDYAHAHIKIPLDRIIGRPDITVIKHNAKLLANTNQRN